MISHVVQISHFRKDRQQEIEPRYSQCSSHQWCPGWKILVTPGGSCVSTMHVQHSYKSNKTIHTEKNTVPQATAHTPSAYLPIPSPVKRHLCRPEPRAHNSSHRGNASDKLKIIFNPEKRSKLRRKETNADTETCSTLSSKWSMISQKTRNLERYSRKIYSTPTCMCLLLHWVT